MQTKPESSKKIWFVRKTYGFGWTPATWQGWLSLAAYIVLLYTPFFLIDLDLLSIKTVAIRFALYFSVLTAVLIFLCYKKGESPRWQWGEGQKKKK